MAYLMTVLLQISRRMLQWRNFENLPVFDEVMCRLRWLTFFAHPVQWDWNLVVVFLKPRFVHRNSNAVFLICVCQRSWTRNSALTTSLPIDVKWWRVPEHISTRMNMSATPMWTTSSMELTPSQVMFNSIIIVVVSIYLQIDIINFCCRSDV